MPLSIATAVYLTELAPLWIRQPLISLIEMLAAIPSVILGLWGIFVMIPWLRDYPFPFLKETFGWTPLFTGPIYGVSMLAGGIIIAIMILPIITSVSREILRSVPNLQREAAYALGATRWEVTRIAVLSYARKGLFGAVILGLGRALGETMAVTMVIGNTPQIAPRSSRPVTRWPASLPMSSPKPPPMFICRRFSKSGWSFLASPFWPICSRNCLSETMGRTRQQRAPCNDMNPTTEPASLAQNQERAAPRPLIHRALARDRAARLSSFFTCCSSGVGSVNWAFFTDLPETGRRGGRRNGRTPLSARRVARRWPRSIGVPIGVLGGVYLAEYGSARGNSMLRFVADVLNGVPSIIWGVVVYGLVVLRSKVSPLMPAGSRSD